MDLFYALFGFLLSTFSFYLFIYLINNKFERKYASKAIIPLAVLVFLFVLIVLSFFSVSDIVILLVFGCMLFLFTLLFYKGNLLQMLLWVLLAIAIYAISMTVSTTYIMGVVSPEFSDLQEIPSAIMLQVSLVATLTQSMLTVLFARRKNRNIKISPLVMVILVLIPLLSSVLLAELTQYSYAEPLNTPTTTLHIYAAVCVTIINLAVFVLYERMSTLTEESLRQQAELQRASLEKTHYGEIQTLYQNTRVWRHDYRNHLQVIKGLTDTKKYGELSNYLGGIEASLNEMDFKIRSGNDLLDAIINSKAGRAETLGITFDVKIAIPNDLSIDSVDLTSLIGNLLNNAIEACERIEEQGAPKYIHLNMQQVNDQLVISVKNSMNGQLNYSSGRLVTSKDKRNHGIGLTQISSITKKYNGYQNFNAEGNTFETLIRLPLPQTQS